jgi:hypothetical protein
MGYIDSLGEEVELRRSSFKLGLLRRNNIYRIHVEKGDELIRQLTSYGLAITENNDPNWCLMEASTGNEFMSYLAACLGELREIDSIPITDTIHSFEDFILSGSTDIHIETKLRELRLSVLDELFPFPLRPISIDELLSFKVRHGDKLSRFRNSIEQELVRIADISDAQLRQRAIELLKTDYNMQIEDIKENMRVFGWDRFVFGKLFSIIAPLPGISSIFSLISALYNAFSSPRTDFSRSPLLYAAIAQKRLFST